MSKHNSRFPEIGKTPCDKRQKNFGVLGYKVGLILLTMSWTPLRLETPQGGPRGLAPTKELKPPEALLWEVKCRLHRTQTWHTTWLSTVKSVLIINPERFFKVPKYQKGILRLSEATHRMRLGSDRQLALPRLSTTGLWIRRGVTNRAEI